MSYVEGQGFEPGDICRHRKDKVDYVIDSIAAVGAGAGVSLLAVSLWSNKMQEFQAQRMSDLPLDTVRRNVEGSSPRDVANKIRQQMHTYVNKRNDVLAELIKDENRVFRDFLMLSGEIEESQFNQSIVDVADSLVYQLKGIPSSEQIYKLFRANISPDVVTDSFIATFAEELSTACYKQARKAGIGKKLTDQAVDAAKDMFFSAEHTYSKPETARNAFNLIKELSNYRASKSGIGSRLFESGTRYGGSELPAWKQLGGLLNESFQARGARPSPILEETLQNMAKSLFFNATKGYKEGRKHEAAWEYVANTPRVPGHVISENMHNFRMAHHVSPAQYRPPEYLQRVRTSANAPHINDMSALRPFTSLREEIKASKDLPDTIKDTTGKLLKRVVFADKETVLRAFSNKKFDIDGMNLSLKNPGVKEKLARMLQTTDYLAYSADHLRDALERDDVDIIQFLESGKALADSVLVDTKGLAQRHYLDPMIGQTVNSQTPRVTHIYREMQKNFAEGPFDEAVRAAYNIPDGRTNIFLSRVGGKITRSLGDFADRAMGDYAVLSAPTEHLQKLLDNYSNEQLFDEAMEGEQKALQTDYKSVRERLIATAQEVMTPTQGPVSSQIKDVTNLAAVFEDAKGMTSATFARIKNLDGNEQLSVLASNLSVAVDVQWERIRDFAENGVGHLLDIEASKSGAIYDMSLIDRGGNTIYGWEAKGGELGNLRALAKILKGKETGTGGMNINYDFQTLAERALVYHDVETAKVFQKHSLENGFDLQILAHAAGYDPGAASQQNIMYHLHTTKGIKFEDPHAVELHKARPDNLDANKIVSELWNNKVDKNLKMLTPKEFEAEEMVLFGTEATDPTLFGRMFRVIGLHQNHTREAFLHTQEMDFRNGKMIAGAESVRTYKGGIGQAMANIKMSTTVVDKSEITAFHEIGIKASNDRVERSLRALSPFSTKINDVMRGTQFAWTNAEGSFGAVHHRVEANASRIIKGMVNDGSIESIRRKALSKGSTTDQEKVIAEYARKVTQHIDDPRLAARVQQRVASAIASPMIENDYTDSALTQFMESPVGRMLEEAAGDTRFGKGNLHSVLHEVLLAKTTPQIQVSLPRISFKSDVLTGLASPASLSERNGAQSIANAVNTYASQIMFALVDQGPHKDVDREAAAEVVQAAMKEAGMNVELLGRVKQQAAAFIDSTGATERHHYSKEALDARRDIGLLGKEHPQYGDLVETLGALKRSTVFKGLIADSFELKAQALETVDEQGAIHAQEMRKVKAALEEALKTANDIPQTVRRIVKEHIESGGLDPFKDRYVGISLSEYTSMSQEVADNLKTQVEEILENELPNGGTNAVSVILDKMREARDNVFANGGGESGESRRMAAQLAGGRRFTRRFMSTTDPRKGASAMQVEALSSLANSTMPAATTGRAFIREAHTMNMGRVLENFKPVKSKYLAPLMLAGGVLSLMAAHTPSVGHPPGEHNGLFAGQEDGYAAISEIPGSADPSAVWTGQEDPFKLDITFNGFISDKEEHDSLMRQVHDAISNKLEVRRVNSSVQDRRNRLHSAPAREVIRGGF